MTQQDSSKKSELVENLEDLIGGWFVEGEPRCSCRDYDEKIKLAEGAVEQLLRHYDVKSKGSQ